MPPRKKGHQKYSRSAATEEAPEKPARVVKDAFYTLSRNIPAIFLIHLEHSCYILSVFEVHSKYSNCILFEFLDARTVFGSHSGSILTAFVQHSNGIF